ncbi:hypothetical protein PtB15_18B105 [Puccinia triticina]|nr:hypothetical protein PtB15_18B105 [Puccinia triticina]
MVLTQQQPQNSATRANTNLYINPNIDSYTVDTDGLIFSGLAATDTNHVNSPEENGANISSDIHIQDPIVNASPEKRLEILPEDIMEEIVGMDLDALRKQEALHAKIKRLPAYLKPDLDSLYNEFKCQLLIFAIKNQIHASLFYVYLGQLNRMRGPTSYNNFCCFDTLAREIFAQKILPLKERCKNVGKLWKTFDDEIKAKYKDPDYLETIRGDVPMDFVNGIVQTVRQANVASKALMLASNKKSITFVQRWAKETIDRASFYYFIMNELSGCHKIQGFMVIASGRSSGDLFIQGGTKLGQEYLDMLRQGGDPVGKFHTLAAGMAVRKEILSGTLTRTDVEETDKTPSSQSQLNLQANLGAGKDSCDAGKKKYAQYCQGTLKKNKKEISVRMLDLLNAAGGKHFSAWPGKNAISTLHDAKIQMKIKQNSEDFHANKVCQPVNQLLIIPSQRILQALTKGWISLKYRGGDSELSDLDKDGIDDRESNTNQKDVDDGN